MARRIAPALRIPLRLVPRFLGWIGVAITAWELYRALNDDNRAPYNPLAGIIPGWNNDLLCRSANAIRVEDKLVCGRSIVTSDAPPGTPQSIVRGWFYDGVTGVGGLPNPQFAYRLSYVSGTFSSRGFSGKQLPVGLPAPSGWPYNPDPHADPLALPPLPYPLLPYRRDWPGDQGPKFAYAPPRPYPEDVPWEDAWADSDGRRGNVSHGNVAGPPRKPPVKPREKEAKTPGSGRAGSIAYAGFRALGAVSEANDFAEALWGALPRRFRTRGANAVDRWRDLWRHWRHVDVARALANLAYNEVEDRLIGAGLGAARRASVNLSGGHSLWRNLQSYYSWSRRTPARSHKRRGNRKRG